MAESGEQFRRIYQRRFSDESRKAKAAVWKVLVESFFQKWIGPHDVVLDLGCGYGEFLNHLKCGRKIGVDMNPDSAEHLGQDVEFHAADVCEPEFLPDGSVDCVFTSNLMEHLPGKPAVEKMLGQAWRILKPGGHFIALGPNLRLLGGQYWDFWDHLVPITDRSLAEALELVGFSVVDCIPKFLPYTTCSRIPQKPWLVKLYLSLPIVWRLMGGQFVIRARKVEQ